MKAVVVSSPGGPEVLEVVERQKPILKAGWTLVKIQGFGINHSEIFTRQGLSPSVQFPRVLGIECVGLVEQTTRPDLKKGKFPEIHLVGTSRNLAKEDQLKVVGFDQVILEKDGVLQSEESFTKILDLVGPRHIKDSIHHLSEGGIICSCGQLGGQWTLADFDPIVELAKNVYLTTFYSGNVSNEMLQELIDFVELYQVDVRPEKVYKLEEIQEAHTYLESSQSFGKVIVKIEE